MGVQVSYKKQFLFGIMLLVVVLVVVEGFANIWWYNINTCAFENNELFDQLDDESKTKLCQESFDLEYTESGIIPSQKGSTVSINSEGFRGPEITLEKPDNTYRIFVVGGSTTFGINVLDNETAPFFLQEKFDNAELDYKVQVINAGIPSLTSKEEVKMVKKRLVNFNPDLFIVYDGFNELVDSERDPKNNATAWKERWIEICNIGNEYGFDTLITLQPISEASKRVPMESERHLFLKPQSLDRYPSYINQLNELNTHCSRTADLREIFDHILEPIYFDGVHVVAKGNLVVAENLYNLALPIVLENAEKKTFCKI